MKWILMFASTACFVACSPDETPSKPTAPAEAPVDKSKVTSSRTEYFRSFDKFGLRGVDRLEQAPASRPHVAITPREDGRVEVLLRSGRGHDVRLNYEVVGSGHHYESTIHYPDEPFAWVLRSVHLVSEVEHTYEHYCDLDPSAPEARCILAKYVRAEPGTRMTLVFPVFVSADEASKRVEGRVRFDPATPVPTDAQAKAIERTASRDRLDAIRGRLVRTIERESLGSGGAVEDQDLREFDVRVYPPEFVDFHFFGEVMAIDE
ncbi:MAG: hypothetical protein R6X02_01055 [Enhygromyxa sp.]